MPPPSGRWTTSLRAVRRSARLVSKPQPRRMPTARDWSRRHSVRAPVPARSSPSTDAVRACRASGGACAPRRSSSIRKPWRSRGLNASFRVDPVVRQAAVVVEPEQAGDPLRVRVAVREVRDVERASGPSTRRISSRLASGSWTCSSTPQESTVSKLPVLERKHDGIGLRCASISGKRSSGSTVGAGDALAVVERDGVDALLAQQRGHLSPATAPVEDTPRLAAGEIARERAVHEHLRPRAEIRVQVVHGPDRRAFAGPRRSKRRHSAPRVQPVSRLAAERSLPDRRTRTTTSRTASSTGSERSSERGSSTFRSERSPTARTRVVDQLYGRGFTLYGLLDDEPIDRRLAIDRARQGDVRPASSSVTSGATSEASSSCFRGFDGSRLAFLDGADYPAPYPYALDVLARSAVVDAAAGAHARHLLQA